MNTLTQQQINQYQWQVADGVARPVNPHVGYVFAEADKDYIFEQNQLFEKFDEFAKQHEYFTNAHDGIYSGEAFEEPVLQFSINQIQWDGVTKKDYAILKDDAGIRKWSDEHGLYLRLFLRLKPSHLPAVLTTQPGEEWKDRYREVWYFTMPTGGTWNEVAIKDNFKSFEDWQNQAIQYNAWATKREWHLNTPHAEQEAETVDNNGTIEPVIDCGAGARSAALWLDDYCNKSLPYHNMVSDAARKAANHIQHLQSTLAQKDQRIAELEREREWISVEDRLPEDKTRVLCVAAHPKGNRWIQIYRYVADIGFDWMHDYEPILWMPLPTPPQH